MHTEIIDLAPVKKKTPNNKAALSAYVKSCADTLKNSRISIAAKVIKKHNKAADKDLKKAVNKKNAKPTKPIAKATKITRPKKEIKKPRLAKIVKLFGGNTRFSELSGIGASTISKLIYSDRVISDDVAIKICNITDNVPSFKVLKKM